MCNEEEAGGQDERDPMLLHEKTQPEQKARGKEQTRSLVITSHQQQKQTAHCRFDIFW